MAPGEAAPTFLPPVSCTPEPREEVQQRQFQQNAKSAKTIYIYIYTYMRIYIYIYICCFSSCVHCGFFIFSSLFDFSLNHYLNPSHFHSTDCQLKGVAQRYPFKAVPVAIG